MRVKLSTRPTQWPIMSEFDPGYKHGGSFKVGSVENAEVSRQPAIADEFGRIETRNVSCAIVRIPSFEFRDETFQIEWHCAIHLLDDVG